MSSTERMTAPTADAASVLFHELRRRFNKDGVIDLEEKRLLRLSAEVSRSANEADEQLGVLLSGFRVDGIRSRQFKRRVREFERDWPPKPAGPAAAKREAA